MTRGGHSASPRRTPYALHSDPARHKLACCQHSRSLRGAIATGTLLENPRESLPDRCAGLCEYIDCLLQAQDVFRRTLELRSHTKKLWRTDNANGASLC